MFIIILAVTGYAVSEKKGKILAAYMAAVFLCFTFLASFRYAIGFDYFSYQRMYRILLGWSFRDTLRVYWHEPLFPLLCKVCGLFGCSYQMFLVFANIFLFLAAVNFIYRYSKLPWLSVYLYITLQFLAYNMNLIRQSFAVAFFLIAYPYLRDRKIVPFTVLIVLGGMFHNSLWLVFPLFFLLHWENTARSAVLITVVGLSLYFLFDPVFSLLLPVLPEKYTHYFEHYFWSPVKFYYAIPAAVYCILVYLFRNRAGSPVKRQIYLNSALYTFLTSLFITKHFILERFSIFPFVFSLLAIPEIVFSFQMEKGCSEKHRKNYYWVLFLFLLFGAAYFLFAAAKGYHHVYPYVSLLDKSISSPE